MAMQTLKKILYRCQMDRAGVILLEQLCPKQQQVDEYGVGNNFGNLLNGLILDFELGIFTHQKKDQDHEGRTRTEC